MRILAVDYGEKRVGLAISDPLEITANPLAVLGWKGEETLAGIARVVRDEGVDEVVVGLPLHADGSRGPAAEAAQAFAQALAGVVAVPVRLHNEYLTTVEAEGRVARRRKGRGGRRPIVDSVAAAVLLEDYLRARRG